jgi:hypothetical protein
MIAIADARLYISGKTITTEMLQVAMFFQALHINRRIAQTN